MYRIIHCLTEAPDLVKEAEDILNNAVTDEIKPGVIKAFFEQLPQKALVLGVRILLALIFFIIGTQIIKLIRKIVRKSMTQANADKGAVSFMDSFIKGFLYIILIFMIAASFGVDAASIVALVGSAGVAVGLAVQGSLSNLAGGILLLILKPFRIGDYIIDSDGHEGTVEEIQLFYTRLLTPDNQTVILPNGSLSNNCLTNVTAAQVRRLDIRVGISYQADLFKAKEALLKMLENEKDVLKEKEHSVLVEELGDSAVILVVRCFIKDDLYWPARYRLTEECKYVLDRAGIEIPYPQMDVHVK